MNRELWPSEEKLKKALDNALFRVDHNMKRFGYCFPSEDIEDKRFYGIIENVLWTAGFWPGTLWLSWELTGNEKYKERAIKYLPSFKRRMEKEISLNHHDLGFIYSLACVSAYMLTGDEECRDTAIAAAEHLAKRFEDKGEFITAWGSAHTGNPDGHFYIIDCMLNVPLLYWAYNRTGRKHLKEIADKHVATTMNTNIRPDGSTYHKFYFDPETGEPRFGKTAQGYADDSAWSRGQSWAVYGFALNYAETKNPKSLEAFKKVADYFSDNLPDDLVPFWDFVLTDEKEPRDSSASLIYICGILEMLKVLPDDEDVKRYEKIAAKMLDNIIDKYTTKPEDDTDGIVCHVTGSVPHNEAIDAVGSYADYYFMEIMARLLLDDWKRYW